MENGDSENYLSINFCKLPRSSTLKGPSRTPHPCPGPLTVVICLLGVSPFHLGLAFCGSRSFYQHPGLRGILVWIWLSWNPASSSGSSLNSRLIMSSWEFFASGWALISKGKTEARDLDTGMMLFPNVMVTLVFSIVSSWCSSWANHFLPP